VLGWAILLPFIMIGLTVVFKPILNLLQKRCGTTLPSLDLPRKRDQGVSILGCKPAFAGVESPEKDV
jgi:hypothetical protein